MLSTTQKVLIREMSPDELQELADELYAKCKGNILCLSPSDHEALRECVANYFDMTGEPLQQSPNSITLY